MPASRFLAAALALFLPACQPDSGGEPAADPNPTEGPATPVAWTSSPTPEFTISGGVLEGDSILFHGIEGAVFNEDGSFVVATGATGEPGLMHFRADGQLLRTVGRSGAGPGEFSAISGIFTADDELVVWDPRLRRLSWFNELGQVEKVTPFSEYPGIFVGVMKYRETVSTPVTLDTPEVPRPYVIRDSTGVPRDTINGPLEPPDASVELMLLRPPFPPLRATSFNLASLCLPTLLHAVVGNRVAVADGRRGTLSLVDPAGERETLLEGNQGSGRVVITAELLQRVRENVTRTAEAFSGPPVTIPDPDGNPYVLPTARAESGAVDREVARVGEPGDSLPSRWSRMLTDADREIWLERATCLEDGQPSEWTAVDVRTGSVRTVAIPGETRLLAVRNEWVLTKSLDSLGVEYIQLHRLIPSGSGGR